MKKKDDKTKGGQVHALPPDMRKALASSKKAGSGWRAITPLARNEWICWVISPKRPETREKHIRQMLSQLAEGKRRPCCWMGCIHRTDKPVSPSVRGILEKREKRKK